MDLVLQNGSQRTPENGLKKEILIVIVLNKAFRKRYSHIFKPGEKDKLINVIFTQSLIVLTNTFQIKSAII